MNEKKEKGMVYVFTGDGKGKTSAALGVAIRMLSLDKKVVWVSWYKNKDWDISEMKLAEKYPGSLRMYWMGKGFYIKGKSKIKQMESAVVYDHDTVGGHKYAAESAYNFVCEVLSVGIPHWGMPDLIVLDEVLKAVDDGLLVIDKLISLIKECDGCHLVLTGRLKDVSILEKYVDLISEVKKNKHPFDEGKLAIRGLDY